MKLDAMLRWIVFSGVLAGFVLHAYTCFFVPDGGPSAFTFGLFALSVLPYVVCLVAGTKSLRGQLMAACAILPLFLLDALAFNEAILATTTSTSSLALVIVPVVNLIVLLLGFLVGGVAFALLRRNSTSV